MKEMTKRFSPNDDLTKLVQTMMPFATTLGFEIIEGTPEKVVARVKWDSERCTANGFLHGGYIMAAADCAGNVCTGLNLNKGARTSTIESKTNFFSDWKKIL